MASKRPIFAILSMWLLLVPASTQGAAQGETVDTDAARCLALTLYWEARAGGREAMIPVGWVVLNRRSDPAFGGTVCEVIRRGGEKPPCQFSYWCDGEPDVPENEEAWKLAKKVAADLLTNPPRDPTQGALFYHSVGVSHPWTRDRKRTAQIGRHIFYR